MKAIYIASPYTKGDTAINVRESLKAAEILREAGFLPFCPLLTHFWHCIFPHDHKFWMEMDLEWLSRCDGLLRLSGESAGADMEVEYAELHAIPVFYSIPDVEDWFASGEGIEMLIDDCE